MAYVDFLTPLHKKTTRDYLERVVKDNKAECATEAKKFGENYWDGDRKYGYGGYRYDGRWKAVAEKIAAHYNLAAGSRVLDVGCGKAFLLYELYKLIPGLEIIGIDISNHAIKNAPNEVQPFLKEGRVPMLPYPDDSFDLVLSINFLHNLYVDDLEKSIKEIERVGRANRYIVVESYRNEQEKANLLYWQLTCECFYTPHEWEWLFSRFGYTGDHSFIFFE